MTIKAIAEMKKVMVKEFAEAKTYEGIRRVDK